MSASFSPENERYIEDAIATGQYETREQVLGEAMALLRKRDLLRREVDAGIEQLERGEGMDGDEVFERLDKRAARLAEQADDS